MSFDWHQYLVVAKYLADPSAPIPGSEAKHRAAISRAYYCAHWKVRQFLETEGRIDVASMANKHTDIPNRLENETDVVRRRIGVSLNRLKTVRNDADYEDFSSANWEAACRGAILTTEKILGDLLILNNGLGA